MRRLAHFAILSAFLFSCGGQWYVLQGIAWANMIREYSQVVPLSQAIQMTFSGQYPCPLCKALAEKKQSENSKTVALQKQEKKIFSPDLFLTAQPITPSPQVFLSWEPQLQTRSEDPPTPPPRLA